MLRIPSDARDLWRAFVDASVQRARSIDSVLDLPAILDYVTLGFFSGLYRKLADNRQRMRDDPSLFNILNWMTVGSADVAKGTFAPDEPLSLEHWLDSYALASILFSVHSLAKQSAAVHNRPEPYAHSDPAAFREEHIGINFKSDSLLSSHYIKHLKEFDGIS